jgi:hypothetical protein
MIIARGQRDGDHDSERGHPVAGQAPEAFGEKTVVGGGQRHLGADHGPTVERTETGDDHCNGHHVARPGAAEHGVGGIGKRRGRLTEPRTGQDAEDGGEDSR